MRITPIALLIAVTAAATGCTTTGMRSGPVDAIRYHLGTPIAPGSVTVEPVTSAVTLGGSYQAYLTAVSGQLGGIGFAPAADPRTSTYIASVSFTRVGRGPVKTRPPLTIGLGVGTGGGGFGVGGGGSVGIGSKTGELVASELAVQLRRRGSDSVVWEGRAVTESVELTGEKPMADLSDKLARALFRGFPGESGITITVK